MKAGSQAGVGAKGRRGVQTLDVATHGRIASVIFFGSLCKLFLPMPLLSALSLPPPQHWQDFEDICCDLWRCLWDDPETQKNGRSGQPQAGVDIFGRPSRGSEWAGVQCKLRAGSASLTRDEIEQEVERARTFRPTLSSFVIATTATRDAKIQEYAREITAGQLRQNSFPVSVFAWEDIQHKLAEFPDLVRKHYPSFFPISPKSSQPLRILLDRVERFWISGVLEASLHGEALIALGKQIRSDAVEHPWGRILEIPGQPDQPLSAEHTIQVLFVELSGFFLILGEPGSGKTTTLLELARTLIDSARKDPSEPVPVVLNLSTWASDQKSLADWLIDELSSKYFVSRRQAISWIEGNSLLLLLDGLDEVESHSRRACVEAINEFVQQTGAPGLVVCSRSIEYHSLPVRLRLNGAIHLLPLAPTQIAEYLNSSGTRLAALAAAVERDSELRELAQSPLMLSIMILACHDLPVAVFSEGQSNEVGVFSMYILRMFQRKGRGKALYKQEKTLRWLSSLARQLQRESKTQFLIEQLQPSWLETRSQRWAYFLSSRLITGAAICISYAALGIWGSDHVEAANVIASVLFACMIGAILGLSAGFFDIITSGIANRQTMPRLASLVSWAAGYLSIFSGLVISVAALGARGRLSRDDIFLIIFILVLLAPVGLIFGSRARHGMSRDIQVLEAFNWSWRKSLKSGAMNVLILVGGGIVCLLVVTASVTADETSPMSKLDYSFGSAFLVYLFIALYFIVRNLVPAVLVLLLCFLLGGLGGDPIQVKTRLNQGIILSMRNGLLTGLGALTLIVVGGSLIGSLDSGGLLSPPRGTSLFTLGALIGWGVALWFGFIDVINHYTLRFFLWSSGFAPLRYSRFLDYTTRLIFMQRVGGGYIFRHRLLLRHFANRDVSGKA